MNFNKYKNIPKQYDISFDKAKERKYLKRLALNKAKSLGKSGGSIVTWHKGGGVRRNYKPLFNYAEIEANYGLLRSIEYDANRTAFIGLVQLETGGFLNVIVSSFSKIGDVISLKDQVDLNYNKAGDHIKLKNAPRSIFYSGWRMS